MAVILWNIWNSRNAFIFDSKVDKPRQINVKAVEYLQWYQSIQSRRKDDVKPKVDKWKPPPQTCLKLNVDAVVNEHIDRSTTGAII